MEDKSFLQIALEQLEILYPSDVEYNPIVEEKAQVAEIKILKNTIKYEQFFFVLNLTNRKIEHAHGLSDWLGYADSQFGLFDYFKIIHPRHLQSLNINATSAFDTANSDEFNLKFMHQKIVVQLPLLHKNGKYYLTKRTLYPFQIDKSGKVLSYLNHFVLLKEYQAFDVLDIRVGKDNQLNASKEENALKKKQSESLDKILQELGLKDREFAILKLLSEKPNLKHKEIAEILGENIITIQKTDSKRILNKARDYFQIEAFSNLKEVAMFMKREGLL
ncbi:hypothetical protein EGI22_08225 [Lacihabitans sp. LS3-19]|uniref:hypothetical protein n=1 Tax=Lacihabitans sp. LS3-19 TaxID=2487335 RepID=UPI0020CC673E|nr:hypothetical protein [Lacihabitans sp. LS3-19]MCP9767896.1 hypothetical protein [Lacihabitans sp. LS3-19]